MMNDCDWRQFNLEQLQEINQVMKDVRTYPRPEKTVE